VNSGSLRSPWSVRVYTIVAASILACTLTATAAPVRITVEPTMIKGSLKAPVTIVEFSDYQ
jgi:protein-disulfide isomerase